MHIFEHHLPPNGISVGSAVFWTQAQKGPAFSSSSKSTNRDSWYRGIPKNLQVPPIANASVCGLFLRVVVHHLLRDSVFVDRRTDDS